VDAFLLSHELQAAVAVCPDRWAAALAQVRAVYKGNVSTAFQPDILDPVALASVAPWAQDLDFVGIDCYLLYDGMPAPPALPWQDTDVGAIAAAMAGAMPAFANMSAALGDKPVVCTEARYHPVDASHVLLSPVPSPF